MLFELCVEVLENTEVLLQDCIQLIVVHLVGVVRGRLQLVILLAEPLIKLRHLLLIIFAERLLLLVDYFVNLREEVLLVSFHVHLTLGEDLAHELRQILQIIDAVLGPLLDLIVQVPEISVEVIHLEKILVNESLLRLIQVAPAEVRQPKHSGDLHLLIGFALRSSFAILGVLLALVPRSSRFLSHLFCVFKDTFLAQWLFTPVYNGFREVFFTNILLHLLLL